MRCPKCGYISFDHIDTCLRCNKDVSKASAVEGTTYNVAAPAFLKFTKRDHSDEEKNEISFDTDDDDFGVVDPDLDVLVEDNEDDGEEDVVGGGECFYVEVVVVGVADGLVAAVVHDGGYVDGNQQQDRERRVVPDK